MGFKTFNSGDILTASDVNTYLMKQAAIVCTSSTRPASPVTGMLILETDTQHILVYDGSIWSRWSHYTSAGRTGLRLTRSANQSINNNTDTSISWDTIALNSDGYISVPSTTITIPTGLGGTYSLTTNVTYASAAGTIHYVDIEAGGVSYRSAGISGDSLQTWTGVIALASADTVVIRTNQQSGGSLNCTARLEMFLLAR